MKVRIVALMLLLGTSLVAAAQTEVKSKIEKVTVYPTSALVEKSITVPLQKGDNYFLIRGNSRYVNRDEVHFESSTHWYVSSLTNNTQTSTKQEVLSRLMPATAYQQYQTLSSQVDDLTLKKSNSDLLINALTSQKEALNHMRAISNTSSFVNVDSLRLQLEFQCSELQKINTKLDQTKRERQEYEKKLTKLNGEIDNLVRLHTGGSKVNCTESNIAVHIYSDKAVANARIPFSYKVPGVTCNYFYDVLLDEETQKAVFVLKASVNQNSGEHWNNCPLVFSTMEAGEAGYDAQLNPYYIDVDTRTPRVARKAISANSLVSAVALQSKAASDDEDAVVYEAAFSAPAEASELTLAREYALTTSQIIPSGEPAQTMLLQYDTTDVLFTRYTTPKSEEKVRYTALLPNWESLGLHDTRCNVYMGGRYVSQSYVQTAGTGDTMRFAVGEDHNVQVRRQLVKGTPASSGVLSKEVDATVTVTITLKNTKNEKLTVSLKDQVPLSSSADIKVIPNVGDGQLDELTGVVRWNVSLAALEQKTITFSYTVRAPKEKISLLNLE